EQMAKDADITHSGRNRAPFGAAGPLRELFKFGGPEVQLWRIAAGQITAQGLAALLQVNDLGTVSSWPVRLSRLRLLFRYRNFEALHKLREPGVGQFLFLVGGVAGLVRPHAVALNGLRQNHSWGTTMLDSPAVGIENLHPVVTAAMEIFQLLIGL